MALKPDVLFNRMKEWAADTLAREPKINRTFFGIPSRRPHETLIARMPEDSDEVYEKAAAQTDLQFTEQGADLHGVCFTGWMSSRDAGAPEETEPVEVLILFTAIGQDSDSCLFRVCRNTEGAFAELIKVIMPLSKNVETKGIPIGGWMLQDSDA